MYAKIVALNISFSFDKATGDGLTPVTQTVVAEHVQEERIHLDELKWSEHADLIRWFSQLIELIEHDEHVRFRTIARHAKISGRACVDNRIESVRMSPARMSRNNVYGRLPDECVTKERQADVAEDAKKKKKDRHGAVKLSREAE